MSFNNLGNLIDWLNENLKAPNGYDLSAVLDDLTRQRGETGMNIYEIRSSESKSGRPECFNYEAEERVDPDCSACFLTDFFF